METFQVSRDGNQLKSLATAIASLFKRKKIKDQIQSLYHNFKPIKGLGGRDLELWIGMLVLAQIIDTESPSLKLFDQVVKIAITKAEKKDEDLFFLDWDLQFLLAVNDYFSTHPSDRTTYNKAEDIFNHVIDKVKPPFPIRTEGLGKILDKEGFLLERKLVWFKDETGNSFHKTGWRIEIDRLKRRVAKFKKFIQSYEDHPDPQMRSLAPIADLFDGPEIKED